MAACNAFATFWRVSGVSHWSSYAANGSAEAAIVMALRSVSACRMSLGLARIGRWRLANDLQANLLVSLRKSRKPDVTLCDLHPPRRPRER